MTGLAWTLTAALAITWAGSWAVSWWDHRNDRAWRDEPLSRLDRADGLHDRDELLP